MLRGQNITCDACGADSIPKHVEIIADPNRPSAIVDLLLWIDCPNCGPRKQPVSPDPPASDIGK